MVYTVYKDESDNYYHSKDAICLHTWFNNQNKIKRLTFSHFEKIKNIDDFAKEIEDGIYEL